MNSGFLDMLHDARHDDSLTVRQGVDIDLDRVLKKAVDQHRAGAGHLDRLGQIALQVGAVMDDFHRPPTKHIGRAHHHRIADIAGQAGAFLG